MVNPLDIEHSYQRLLSALAQPAASWRRGMLATDFLESLAPHAAEYESYVLDALDRLYPAVRTADLTGLAPEELSHPLEVLDRIRSALPRFTVDPRFNEMRLHLRKALCESLAYVRDVRALIAAMDDRSGKSPASWLQDLPEHLLHEPVTMLRHLAVTLARVDPPAARSLSDLGARWKEAMVKDADTVHVPVVECDFGGGTSGLRSVLRTVRVLITGEREVGQDRLETTTALYGAAMDGSRLVEAPLAAARSLLNETAPGTRRHFLSGTVTLDQHPALYEADSAGLAIAALFYTATLRHTHQRRSFLIRPDVAMTGVLEASGRVRQVDAVSLASKVRAVFFSRIETLVLPKDQLGPAVAQSTHLNLHYPGRSLTIIGIDHLREILCDQRIIRQRTVSRSLQLLRAGRGRLRRPGAPVNVSGSARSRLARRCDP